MGKGFDIKSAFRLAKQQKVDYDDEWDTPKFPKRNALQEFFKSSAHQRRDKRKTQITLMDAPARCTSIYGGQRPLTMPPGGGGMMRSTSQVIKPPMSTKEPAILSTWGAKSPEPVHMPEAYFSGGLHDSVTSRHQSYLSVPSPTFPSKPESRQYTIEEVCDMFAGAPKFGITDATMGPQPSVTLHQDNDGDSKDAEDIERFLHPAFAAVSLKEDLVEVPAMNSLSVCNPGTVGHHYFLQLPVSDNGLAGRESSPSASKRVELLECPENLGLQPLDLEGLVGHLSELGKEQQIKNEIDQDYNLNEQRVAELYSELFSKFLVPSEFTTAISPEDDASGLEAQIAALVQILDIDDLWFDFSCAEWRIRIGHILWSATAEKESDDEGVEKPAANDYSVVLLQIALASELQLRLDMSGKPREEMRAKLTAKIRWDLVLARQFLNNAIITKKHDVDEDMELKRASIFSITTFTTAYEHLDDAPNSQHIIYPRHEKRQLEGLLKFAETLSWPHTQEISQRFENREHPRSPFSPINTPLLPPALSAYADPVDTADQFTNIQAECSDDATTPTPQQLGKETTIARSMQLSPVSLDYPDAGGWLSRSWLTGLVLPGEAASHMLISSLLENSPAAIEKLGRTADLYGGFIYNGRSYWSKNSVVGRVLAIETGADECMGWVSSPSVPIRHASDGWINIETKDVAATVAGKARAASEDVVAKESSFVPGKDVENTNDTAALIDESEFTWPVDGPPILGNEASYDGLTILPSTNNDGTISTTTSTAYLKFSPKSQKRTVVVPLLHNVYFISSHPCSPPPRRPQPQHAPHQHPQRQSYSQPPLSQWRSSYLSSRPNSLYPPPSFASASSRPHSLIPPSPSFMQPLPSPSPSGILTTEEQAIIDAACPQACHPLHESYKMEVIPAATLLSCMSDSASSSSPSCDDGDDDDKKNGNNEKKVLVLDCKDETGELELLSRAWCAKVGENAVVSRTGETCLACCVREARALGVGVVIRI